MSKTFSNLILLLGVHSLQISIFTNNVFYFAEFRMGFDSEGSEIYYIAEAENEENDESRLSISQTSSGDDQADLCADDPLANEEWTVKYQKEVNADKELERTLNDRLEGTIEVNE